MRTLSLLRCKRIQFIDMFWTHYQWLLGCRKALRVAKISCFLWTSKHQNLSIWFKIIFWTSSVYTGFQELKITYSSHLYMCNNMVCLMGLQSHFRLPGSKEPLPIATNYCNLPNVSGSPQILSEPFFHVYKPWRLWALSVWKLMPFPPR